MPPVSALRSALLAALGLAAATPPPAAGVPTGSPPWPDVVPVAAATSESLATRADAAREEGRLDEAVGLYGQALEKDPSWLEGRWALATLLYDTDRFDEAAGHFTRVVEAHPNHGLALALLGLCLAQTGDHQEALADLLKARSIGIPNPNVASVAAFQTALLLNKAGDPDGANEVLRQFAMDGDDSPPVIQAFGLVILRLPLLPGEIPEAQREMVLLAGRAGYHMARARRTSIGQLAVEELVSRYPAQPNVHFALGMYLLSDDPDAGLAALRRELTVSPDHYVAMIQIAFAELKRGHGAEALPMAQRAVELAPDVPAARLALGRSLLAVGRVDEGVAAIEAAVGLAPENPRLHFALAQAYQQAGRTDDATREKREFLRLEKASAGEGRPASAETGAATSPDSAAPGGESS